MSAYIVSPQARQDLIEIAEYVADHNLEAAFRLRDRLFAAFERLAGRPLLGHVRDDLAPRHLGVRFWPVGRYLIVYRIAGETIEIVRVLSGFRDVAAELGWEGD